jgi:hypothetical protein
MSNWHEGNQRYLMACLSVIRDALQRYTGEGAGFESLEQLAAAVVEARAALPSPPALDSVCELFGLSSFERDLLLLCAGVELDSGLANLCAAQGDSRRCFPTFGLALAALAEPHWSALMPTAALRRWRLIEVGSGDSLTGSSLQIDERVLHHLIGLSYVDPRLRGLVERVIPPADLPPSHIELAERIANFATRATESPPPAIINLCAGDDLEKRGIAAFACARLGVQLHLMKSADVPAGFSEREALSRLWEREAALGGLALLVSCEDADNIRPVRAFLGNVRSLLLVVSREPIYLHDRDVIRLDVNRPRRAEQEFLWREALGPLAARVDGQLPVLVSQFNLSVQGVRAASATIKQKLDAQDQGTPGTELWDACRAQARSRLDNLGQRIEPAATWDDLVLPEQQRQTLRDIAAHVRRRPKVYEEWGFAAKSARGLGISALFAGPSGTGKTMSAEVLANELRLDLYRIDLSQVVSKYIGETEKNLRLVFDAAEEGGAILLFDEADALFGKRSEVKDSHDRYANIEVSYLLQRMETYRGLSILTTNMKQALDTAFLRRIRFIVQFPFPDAEHRAEIWRRVFPSCTPTDGLDFERLGRLAVPGGNIRNIALNAAFLAADSGQPVRMWHLLRAAHTEYSKLDKTPSDAEVRGWA